MSISDLKSVRLLVPSQDRQVSISKILDSIDEATERTEYVIDKTKILKDALISILIDSFTIDANLDHNWEVHHG